MGPAAVCEAVALGVGEPEAVGLGEALGVGLGVPVAVAVASSPKQSQRLGMQHILPVLCPQTPQR